MARAARIQSRESFLICILTCASSPFVRGCLPLLILCQQPQTLDVERCIGCRMHHLVLHTSFASSSASASLPCCRLTLTTSTEEHMPTTTRARVRVRAMRTEDDRRRPTTKTTDDRDADNEGDVQGASQDKQRPPDHYPASCCPEAPYPSVCLSWAHHGCYTPLTTFRASQQRRAARVPLRFTTTATQCHPWLPAPPPRCCRPIAVSPERPENARTSSGTIYVLSVTRRLQA